MRRLTSGWTERHSAVALLTLLVAVASLAGLVDGGWAPQSVPVAVALIVLASLFLDAWSGAIVGLIVTAALVALRRALDAWTPADFGPAAVTMTALVAVGAAAGFAGRRLRSPAAAQDRPTESLLAGAYGSLGLLGPDGARARLVEEVERTARTHRHLTLALLDVRVIAPDLTHESRDAALRTTARLLESRARDHDVPFALAPDRLGVLLPDSAAREAWDVVARVFTAVGAATYVVGVDRAPRRLSDAVELHAGIAQHQPLQGWQALLDEAAAAVDRAGDQGHGEIAVLPHPKA